MRQSESRAICLGKQEGRDFQFAHGCWKSRGRLGVSKHNKGSITDEFVVFLSSPIPLPFWRTQIREYDGWTIIAQLWGTRDSHVAGKGKRCYRNFHLCCSLPAHNYLLWLLKNTWSSTKILIFDGPLLSQHSENQKKHCRVLTYMIRERYNFFLVFSFGRVIVLSYTEQLWKDILKTIELFNIHVKPLWSLWIWLFGGSLVVAFRRSPKLSMIDMSWHVNQNL